MYKHDRGAGSLPAILKVPATGSGLNTCAARQLAHFSGDGSHELRVRSQAGMPAPLTSLQLCTAEHQYRDSIRAAIFLAGGGRG
jgi:hypothetical protein